ncbi:hypothetical protein DAI22_03g139600 [Oryza sativa Japonica Group]|nr:hypothetical protein DAI22_03g139600 [Oryza sativa Japonica Group]
MKQDQHQHQPQGLCLDAAAAAAHAKDKLKERGEKLARISQESAELQNESENFASLAHQIAKSMENKKWWKP